MKKVFEMVHFDVAILIFYAKINKYLKKQGHKYWKIFEPKQNEKEGGKR